jgi:hypothetical protein
LSVVSTEPPNLQVALQDPKWKNAMDEEYHALMKNQTCHLVPPRHGTNIIDVDGFTRSITRLMGLLIGTRLVLLPKGSNNGMDLIMRRLLVML